MLGVSTIGNATLIAFDGAPVLATDPWFGEPTYFGSWALPHRIPDDIRAEILRARYIWFSHGHPDHLHPESLERLRGKRILLGDHVGGRIAHELRAKGFDVSILPDRQWVELSPRVRVFCIPNMIQDCALLIEVNKRLFVNLNDASTSYCTLLIREIAKAYRHAYLMRLVGYGCMLNFYNEQGASVAPSKVGNPPLGGVLSNKARMLGIRGVIPFSSFHVYQRTDSVWAQGYVAPLEAYSDGFDHRNHEYVPPFSFIDCETGAVTEHKPALTDTAAHTPEEFGDCWSDPLERGDLARITDYFRRKEIVRDALSFLNFRVGGRDHTVSLDGNKDRGVTFEVPRNSLMQAIDNEVFDDLLIANFMKTTLHNMDSLYDEEFNTAVTKYADNGRASTAQEVVAYKREYRRRAGMDWYYTDYYEPVVARAGRMVSRQLRRESPIRSLASAVYRFVR